MRLNAWAVPGWVGLFSGVPAICSACQKEIEELAAAKDAAGASPDEREAALRFNGLQGA